MRIKLPKNFFRWAIVSLLFFIVGIIISQFFLCTTAVIGPSDHVSSDYQPLEKLPVAREIKSPPYFVILIVLGVVTLLLGYGYYKERQKK